MQKEVSVCVPVLVGEQVMSDEVQAAEERKKEMAAGFSAYFRAWRNEQVDNAEKRGEILE